MDIQTAVNQLIQAIKATREYNAVKNAKQALMQKPEQSRMLDEFDAKSRRAYESGAGQAINELAADYERLKQYPEINAFLNASEQLGRLMNTMYSTVSSAIGD